MNKFFYVLTSFCLGLLLIALLSAPVIAQESSFVVSKSGDFSTNDLAFDRTDTLYILVVRPDIDFTDIEEMEFKLKPLPSGPKVSGLFTNNLDGSYTASLALDTTTTTTNVWELSVEIEDNQDNKFKATLPITIGVNNGAPPPGTGETIEVDGRITGLEDARIRVRSVWLAVTDATEIVDGDDNPISFADLFLGIQVDVLAVKTSDDSLEARRIHARIGESREGEIEAEGAISEIDTSSITVDGLTFVVTDSTDIRGSKGNNATIDSLRVGLFVSVEGHLQDTTLVADLVKVDEDEERKEKVEVSGPIDALTDTSFSVAGFTFFLDGETEFKGDDFLDISRNGLQVGAVVKVKGEYRSDGMLWALKIELEKNAGSELEEKGKIESIGDHTITLNGVTFTVDSTTAILTEDKQRTDFGALQVGMEVEVKAIQTSDGTYLALRIKIEQEKSQRVKQKGRISALTPNSITVLQTTFLTDSTTVIYDKEKNQILLSDLQVGMFVKVEGHEDATGTLFADRIRVKKQGGEHIEVTAPIDSLDDQEVLVAGIAFRVTETTVILDESEQRIPFSALAKDMLVEVKAKQLPDMTNIALRIKVKNPTNDELEVKGNITVIAGDTVRVEELPFLTDANTLYFDRSDNPLALADFSIGDFVEVKAVLDSSDNLLIVRMKLEEPASLQGSVDDTSSGNAAGKVHRGDNELNAVVVTQFLLVNTTVIVDANTFIVDISNSVVDASAITAGVLVDVNGVLTSTGDVLATSIRILDVLSPTSVGDADPAIAPDNFSLMQNYPNPFNPETKIQFRIPNSTHVTLKVYNLLGQEIARLVDGVLEAGVQTVRWNGSDHNGNPVSSGVYFYKIETTAFTKVMKMTLVR